MPDTEPWAFMLCGDGVLSFHCHSTASPLASSDGSTYNRYIIISFLSMLSSLDHRDNILTSLPASTLDALQSILQGTFLCHKSVLCHIPHPHPLYTYTTLPIHTQHTHNTLAENPQVANYSS